MRLGPRRHGLHCARRVNTETQRVTFRTVRPARIARTAFRPEAIPNPDAQRLSSTKCMRNARRSVGRASLPFLLHPFPLRTRAPTHEHSAYTPLHSVQARQDVLYNSLRGREAICTTRVREARSGAQFARIIVGEPRARGQQPRKMIVFVHPFGSANRSQRAIPVLRENHGKSYQRTS